MEADTVSFDGPDGVHLEALPAEQLAVEAVLEERAAVLSFRAIQDQLGAAGFVPRSRRAWHIQTVGTARRTPTRDRWRKSL